MQYLQPVLRAHLMSPYMRACKCIALVIRPYFLSVGIMHRPIDTMYSRLSALVQHQTGSCQHYDPPLSHIIIFLQHERSSAPAISRI